MSGYDNPLTRSMARYRGDADDVWAEYKTAFSLSKPETRIGDLAHLDSFMDVHMDKPTNEAASLLTCKRELVSIHETLRKANR
jgi:hypothetical protein